MQINKLLKMTSIAILTSAVLVNAMDTKVGFTEPTYKEDNKYGETIFTQVIDIYSPEVQTKKMFYGKSGDYSDNIGTRATIKVTESGTSLCSLFPGKLEEESCSGQKPFFFNTDIPNGVSYLIFNDQYNTEIENISNMELHSFYPIDVLRNEKYYKNTKESKKTYTFLGNLFSSFLGDNSSGQSTFFSNVFYKTTITNKQEADIRQRYIANVLSGIDKEHRLETGVTTVKLNQINNPVSLIDYSEIIESDSKCGTDTTVLKSITGKFFCSLPFFNWFMPRTDTEKFTINTIQQDTEVSLITLAGTNANIKKEIVSEHSSIISNEQSSNQITSLFSKFRCLFGGCQQKEYFSEAMQEVREYNEDKAIRMDIPVVDSTGKVISITPVKLLAIHSIVPQGLGCTFQQKHMMSGYTDEVRVSRESLFEKTGFMVFTRWSEKSSVSGKNKSSWLDICSNNSVGYKFTIKKGMSKKKYKLTEKVDTTARSLIIKIKRIDDKKSDFINNTVEFKIIKMK